MTSPTEQSKQTIPQQTQLSPDALKELHAAYGASMHAIYERDAEIRRLRAELDTATDLLRQVQERYEHSQTESNGTAPEDLVPIGRRKGG